MKESAKSKYFVDGFMLKHFGIWPHGVDKENLFEEQKIFLIYLMGNVPEITDWKTQVAYETELEQINSLKKAYISESDIDVAKLQGRDVEELKKERLTNEKEKRINELRKKYGLKPIVKEEEPIEGLPERPELPEGDQRLKAQERLWDLLQGKMLTNTAEEKAADGL